MFFQDPGSISKSEILDNYFRKIKYTGNRTPTLDNLKLLHQLHPAAIPFENLSPLLSEPVLLDIESIYKKLVLQKRGGYCFEHNLLLGYVLEQLGYNVRGIMARTLYNLPDGKNIFRGHMALLVQYDEINWLVDVGFGGLTLTTPIMLNPFLEQSTSHEMFRLLPLEDELIVEANIKNEWKALYMISLHHTVVNDYELASWYHCEHPKSRFTNRLVVALTAEDKRYALLNNQLSIHHKNGSNEQYSIHNTQELIKLLHETFNIDLPYNQSVEKILEPFLRK